MSALPVSETFTTLQGEGPHAGRRVTFIRLGGCNLSCSWCDTPYTWDSTRYKMSVENPPTDIDHVLANLPAGVPVVVTGGEPLIHQEREAWGELLHGLTLRGCEIHIETNGTIFPNDTTLKHVAHYSISPKLANAGTHKPGQSPTLAPGWDSLLGATAIFKYVCATPADAELAVAHADSYGWPRDGVWLMPEGRDTDTLLAGWHDLATAAVKLKCNATQRLHVLAWGDTKGT